MLSDFRSQHENQSWLAARPEASTWSARRLYAIGRHALGDLSQVLRAAPRFDASDRLSEADFEAIHRFLGSSGVDVEIGPFRERLTTLRKGYEPYAFALSREQLMDLPPWAPHGDRKDSWETTAWEGSAPGASLH